MNKQAKAQLMDEGVSMINLGAGFGGLYKYSGLGYVSTPTISLSYEMGVFPDIGPGTISIGGLIAYKSTDYDWGGLMYYRQHWSYLIIGGRGAYHYDFSWDKKFDPYAGFMMAYYITSYSIDSNDPLKSDPSWLLDSGYSNYIGMSFYVGGRYFFSDVFGAFVEAGYGYSFLTGGLSVKF